MIHLTEKAAAEVKRLISSKNEKEESFLRVQVVGGGCSGMSYKLDFDNAKNDNDKIFEHFGVKLVVDPKSYLYVMNTTIDFSDGLQGTGFNFINPNAKKSCGCGSSFSA
ncbi:MAG: iron-sulfur cluster insertion protein ErpA [Oligoflexia bacterium]|nr:iron-sulfur cluster insertion protein ErpA [Oligoflexia bacterium]